MAFSEGLSQFDPEMLESEHESIVDSEDEDLDVERSFEGLELRDVDLIKQAGENIFRRIMYDFPEELPDAVLLPDKGARPLWSLAKPVFDSLAEQRGVKPPRYFFVSTAKNDLVESGLHLEKHNPRRVERIREAHANDLAERQREQLAKIAADAPYYASREVRMESAQKAGEVIEDVEASSVENEAVTEAELSPTANEERDSNERKGWRRRLANLFTSRQHVPHEIDAEGLKAVEALNDADALHSWRLAEIKERGLKDVVDPTFIIMDEYMTSLQSTVSLIERGLGSHVHAQKNPR